MVFTDEQLLELDGPEPARAVDPRTNATYVVLRAELYERLYPLLQAQSPLVVSPSLPPAAQQSKAAFLRDLPNLLSDKRKTHKWVAYHGDECIAFGVSQRELFKTCFERGLREDECYVGMIVPHAPEPETVDPSLFEFEESPSK
jgi:hypothetical protein